MLSLSIPSSSCRETITWSMRWLTCVDRTAPCWPASCSVSWETSEPKLRYWGHWMTEKLIWRVGLSLCIIHSSVFNSKQMSQLRLDGFPQACSSCFGYRTKLWLFFLYSPFLAMNNCLLDRLSNQTSSRKCAVCSEKSRYGFSIKSIDPVWYVDEFTISIMMKVWLMNIN